MLPTGRAFPWEEVGIHGVARPREWDAVVTTDAPEIEGNEAAFVALPDGELVVDVGEGDLSPLADALEETLLPPYRAIAIRRGATRWAVAAKSIVVAELPDAPGDELELVVTSTDRSLRVNGEPAFGRVAELEAVADGDSVVRARRIDGELFEVSVDPL